MASDYLLEIEGIKGESKDKTRKDAIEILSFSFGATNTPGGSVGGGGGAGKASFSDLSFSARSSKASPQLFLACATGKHFPNAKLYGRSSGGGQEPFLAIKLSDVLVSSYKEQAQDSPQGAGGDQSDLPTDQFSLNYNRISFSFNGVEAGWDVGANKKI